MSGWPGAPGPGPVQPVEFLFKLLEKFNIQSPVSSWFRGIVGSDTPLDGARLGRVKNQLDQCVYESSEN